MATSSTDFSYLRKFSQVSTWIISIARFKALTALERRREPQLDEDAIKTVADDADTPEQTVLHTDRRAQLRRYIAQMSSDHREVIDLVYYDRLGATR